MPRALSTQFASPNNYIGRKRPRQLIGKHPFQNGLIGSICLIKGESTNRGFWLGLPWQRKGLMTEACEAVNDFWFNTLKFSVLRAPKAIANVASRRISEKSGMRIVAREERDYVCGRLPTEIWEITAEEWNTRSTGKFE